MGNKNQEDLDLLLSLDDDNDEKVLETPPGSPSAPPVYLTDEEKSPKRRRQADMSDFTSVVQDYIEPPPSSSLPTTTNKKQPRDNDIEKFSGLRLRNQLLTPSQISDLFSDIRFVRLPTIKNLLMGDKLSGCWATIGVVTEKGQPKTSSIGQPYCIWKLSSLNNDNNTVSLFLFGDAYKNKSEAGVGGSVIGLFNCSLRKDKMGNDFSLSVNSAKQMVKLGVSADYGVCAKRTDGGTTCTSVVNKRQGAFCKNHKQNGTDRFATTRGELKGGNLMRRSFIRDPKSQGIYTVEQQSGNNKKGNQPVRVLSVEGLRKALSGADKVTPNVHSQGIRFLNEMAKQSALKNVNKKSEGVNKCVEKRAASITKETQVKRKREEAHNKETPEIATGKMMVLDFCSSDEE